MRYSVLLEPLTNEFARVIYHAIELAKVRVSIDTVGSADGRGD